MIESPEQPVSLDYSGDLYVNYTETQGDSFCMKNSDKQAILMNLAISFLTLTFLGILLSITINAHIVNFVIVTAFLAAFSNEGYQR